MRMGARKGVAYYFSTEPFILNLLNKNVRKIGWAAKNGKMFALNY